MKKIKLRIGISALVITSVTLLIVYACKEKVEPYTFETEKVERLSIVNTITATGTLEATTTVEVGTQVSGVIEKLYVDFNSVVKKGQLLAEIDKTSLQSSLDEAEASLDNAKAELEYQLSTYERIKALSDKQLVAKADYDQAKYNYDKAKASIKTSRARYDKAIVNLNYASIYSPIDGVIMHRAVDEGQTVAASFNTPTLFSIANDLTQMQVEADVDEADIGQVKDGQRVEFTVDAFPDKIFDGKVLEIRLQPVETSNVITYTVVVDAPNPEKMLMPGMTASITAYVEEIDNVLAVPGKAIRFTPDRDVMMAYMQKKGITPGQRGKNGQGTGGAIPSGTRMAGSMQLNQTNANDNSSRVWVKDGDMVKPVMIESGSSDGSYTEVISGLNEGDEIVVSMTANVKAKTEKSTTSPFMPQRPGSSKK
jgi:HlyD family secretion protein